MLEKEDGKLDCSLKGLMNAKKPAVKIMLVVCLEDCQNYCPA
jgi:hypothetical protein